MRKPKPLRSEMGWSTPDRITVRGPDLCNDLLGKIDLGAMAWLELTGRKPSPQEAEVFNALLVTLVEHGMTPHAIATRMVQACAPEAMQAAVAAGLCAVGSVFAGGSEQVARTLQAALKDAPADADIAALAEKSSRTTSRGRSRSPASAIRCTSRSTRARRCFSPLPSATAFAAATWRCRRRSRRPPRSGCHACCR
jgi:citrate synthase